MGAPSDAEIGELDLLANLVLGALERDSEGRVALRDGACRELRQTLTEAMEGGSLEEVILGLLELAHGLEVEARAPEAARALAGIVAEEPWASALARRWRGGPDAPPAPEHGVRHPPARPASWQSRQRVAVSGERGDPVEPVIGSTTPVERSAEPDEASPASRGRSASPEEALLRALRGPRRV